VKGIRLIGVVAAVLLLLAIGSGIAFAEQDEAGSTDPALSEAPTAEPGPEVVADRTATSRTLNFQKAREKPGSMRPRSTTAMLKVIGSRSKQG